MTATVKPNSVWSNAGSIPADASQSLAAIETDVQDNFTVEDIDDGDTATGAAILQVASSSSGLNTGEGKRWYDTTNNLDYTHSGSSWIARDQLLNVKLFGATGDGATDDVAAIQSAVDAAATLGLKGIYLPGGPAGSGGTYIFDSAPKESNTVCVAVNDPMWVVGDGWGGDSTSAEPTSGLQTVVKAGTNLGQVTMFHFVSSTSAQFLSHCGVRDIALDMNNRAQFGIHMDCVSHGRIESVRILQVYPTSGGWGIWLSDTNGSTTVGCTGIILDQIIIGTGGSAGGILFDGENNNGGCSQIMLRRGLFTHENSDALRWKGNVDNCQIQHAHCVRAVGGTGYGLNTINGASANPRNSQIRNFVGHVNLSSGVVDIDFQMTEEAGSVTAAAGAVAHYVVRDASTGQKFVTDTYRMRDRVWLPASMFQPNSGSARGTLVLGDTIDLDAGGTEYAILSGLIPYDWPTGDITSAVVHWTTASGIAAEVWRCRVEIATVADAETPADKNSASDTDITLPASPQGKAHRDTVTLTDVDFSEGDMVQVRVGRIGGDAADTMTGDLGFLGIELVFEADGPPTTGTWDIPDRST